jgi:RHS repeat-associated protein
MILSGDTRWIVRSTPGRFIIAIPLLFAFSVAPVWAQAGDVFDQFYRYVEVKNKTFEAHLPGEIIDHFTGNLSIVQEDMSFPGKAGLDLRIVRTYSSKIWQRSDTSSTNQPLLVDATRVAIGFGWSMHMGRVQDPYATGPSSYPVYEGPEGAAHVFYPCLSASTSNSPACVGGVKQTSRDNWKYTLDCPTSQSVCITTTSGLRLEFDKANQYFVGLTPILPLSRISDVFGNHIDVYYQSGGTLGGSTGLIDHITDTYSRTITFQYGACYQASPSTCILSVTADGQQGGHRQVAYTYETYTRTPQTEGLGHFPLSSPTPPFLKTVQPAVGTGYTYSYGYTNTVAQNQYALTSITYPNGGRSDYTYAATPFFTGCYTVNVPDMVPMPTVTSRQTSGPNLPPSNPWFYTINSPPFTRDTQADGPFQTLTETRPDGKVNVYEFFGFGRVATMNRGSGNAWRVGLQNSVARDASGPQHGTEVELLEWDQGKPVAPVTYGAPSYSSCATQPNLIQDTSVRSPVLTKKTILRSTAHYETDLENYDEYAEPGTVVETGEANRTTTYQYDHDTVGYQVVGRVKDEKVCQDACFENIRTFTFDGNDNPNRQLDSEILKGIKTMFKYDPDGDLHSVTNGLAETLTLGSYSYGVPTNLNFNGAFPPIARSANWDGTLASETNGRGDMTTYKYDADGRLQLVTPPGGTDQQAYCYNLQPASGTQPAYQDSYSIRRMTYSSGASGDAICLMNANSVPYLETTRLDGLGRVIGTDNSLGEKQTEEFDVLGQLIFSSYPWGNGLPEVGTKLDYDGLSRNTTTSRRYLPTSHRPLSGQCVDPNSCQLAVAYDDPKHCQNITVDRDLAAHDTPMTKACFESFGELNQDRLVGVTDASSKEWSYAHDVAGNLKQFTAPLDGGNRTFTYDPTTFLLKTEQSHPTGTVTVTQYNDAGQPLAKVDARNVTTTFTYNDLLSRLTQTQYSSGSSNEDASRTYDHDLLHTLSSVDGGTYTYGYDALNRLNSQTWSYLGQNYQTSYQFYPNGCLHVITYPTHTVLTVECDAKGRTRSISLSGTTSGTIVNDVSYHPNGHPNVIVYGNGLTVTTAVDSGRVKSIKTPGVLDLTYTYDGANNVKSITDAIVDPTLSSKTVSNISYDPLDRLSHVDLSLGAIDYKYDALGNRTNVIPSTGAPTRYVYDTGNTNRLVFSSGPSAPPQAISTACSDRPVTTPCITLSWNAAGRLAGSSDRTSYKYDGLGRRVRKTLPLVVKFPQPIGKRHTLDIINHYDAAGDLIAETLANGTKLRDYFYVAGQLVAVDGCISSDTPPCNEREWYHTDVLGNVVAHTNAQQTVTQGFAYQPWGGGPPFGTGGAGALLYNGKTRDDGTGFYDYGARFYSPELGRFISADPVWSFAVNPQASNRYAYTLDNPFKYTDADGRAPVLSVVSLVNATVAGGATKNAGSATMVQSGTPMVIEDGQVVFEFMAKLNPASKLYNPGEALQFFIESLHDPLVTEGPQLYASTPEAAEQAAQYNYAQWLIKQNPNTVDSKSLSNALNKLSEANRALLERESSSEFITTNERGSVIVRRIPRARSGTNGEEVEAKPNEEVEPEPIEVAP